MMTQADLDALLLRFETSQATEADRQTLRQLLLTSGQGANEQTVHQLGKYGVNVGEGKDIQIGDRYGLSREELRAIIQELLTLHANGKSSPDDQYPNSVENLTFDCLELNIDAQIIEFVNSRLASIEELNNVKQLTDSQVEKFKVLKSKLYPLIGINRDLQELAAASNQLLQEAIQSLIDKIQELNVSRPDSFSTIHLHCLQQYQELLLQLQADLEDGKEVADWLDKRRKNIAQTLVQQVLDEHPALKQSASPKLIKAFNLSLKQFLERLSHCLIWGRQNTLEFPNTPVVLEDRIYATAFESLKEMCPEELPQGGIDQLNEYIDYLIKRLPYYRHISID